MVKAEKLGLAPYSSFVSLHDGDLLVSFWFWRLMLWCGKVTRKEGIVAATHRRQFLRHNTRSAECGRKSSAGGSPISYGSSTFGYE
jgi:hypothetical protein